MNNFDPNRNTLRPTIVHKKIFSIFLYSLNIAPVLVSFSRGSKHNCGKPELCSSSVGAVKAALVAIDGFNLYGKNGARLVSADTFSLFFKYSS